MDSEFITPPTLAVINSRPKRRFFRTQWVDLSETPEFLPEPYQIVLVEYMDSEIEEVCHGLAFLNQKSMWVGIDHSAMEYDDTIQVNFWAPITNSKGKPVMRGE